jgi:hypothetical protein
LLESLLESFGRGHAAVAVARATLAVARPVERRQHLLAKSGGFLENRRTNVRGGIGKTRQIVVTADLEDVVQQKQHVLGRSLVDGHASPPSASASVPVPTFVSLAAPAFTNVGTKETLATL